VQGVLTLALASLSCIDCHTVCDVADWIRCTFVVHTSINVYNVNTFEVLIAVTVYIDNCLLFSVKGIE